MTKEEALEKSVGKTLERYSVWEDDGLEVFLFWTDGTHTIIKSSYEEDWSEVTPGEGFTSSIREGKLLWY